MQIMFHTLVSRILGILAWPGGSSRTCCVPQESGSAAEVLLPVAALVLAAAAATGTTLSSTLCSSVWSLTRDDLFELVFFSG
jgi:hypothetical protein